MIPEPAELGAAKGACRKATRPPDDSMLKLSGRKVEWRVVDNYFNYRRAGTSDRIRTRRHPGRPLGIGAWAAPGGRYTGR